MKILLVGPGKMPIPSNGWGAVETVIWNQYVQLKKNKKEADILNKCGLFYAINQKPWKYDLVHLHYDEYALLWICLSKIFKFPLIITTHYGYAGYPDKWDKYYKKIFFILKYSPGLIVLNDKIKKVFINSGYKGWIDVLPNGSEVNDILFKNKGNGKALCLGKIEPRKRQSIISEVLNNTKIECDFVGPIVDKSFKVNSKNTNYLGSWNRNEVFKKIGDYSTLILYSDGEAHALVTLEAMAGGCSLVVSPEASAHLEKYKWVSIVNNLSELTKYIALSIKENGKYRMSIRKSVVDSFSWNTIGIRYVALIEKYLRYHEKKNTSSV